MSSRDLAERTRDGLGLSPREMEIVDRAARGATDKEIADDLDLSVATVRTHWTRVRDKLGAANRTHAIALAALNRPAAAPTESDRARLTRSLSRGRLATWVWQPRPRTVLLDEFACRLFGLEEAVERSLPVDRLLTHVWRPDRARLERFLAQSLELRPMTPIELRVGTPGDYLNLVRTTNLAGASAPEPGVLLATTRIHVFA